MIPSPVKHIEAQDPKFIAYRQRQIWIFIALLLFSIAVTLLFNEVGIILGVAAFSGNLIKIHLDLYHKTQVENFYHYRETEALLSLHNLLPIRHPLPSMRLWVISPDLATLIVGVIQQYQPKTIVELGSGTSTIISSYALEKIGIGTIISFEHIEHFAEETRNNLKKHGLDQWATVNHAPLKNTSLGGTNYQWYEQKAMQELHSIDFLVVDGPPDGTNPFARYPALPILFERLSANAIIIVDDFMRDDEYQMVVKWLGDFNLEVIETIANEKGAVVLRKRG